MLRRFEVPEDSLAVVEGWLLDAFSRACYNVWGWTLAVRLGWRVRTRGKKREEWPPADLPSVMH